MISNAPPAPPERMVTAPIAQYASALPAPNQVMEPTAKRDLRIELPMHSRTSPLFIGAVVVLVAGGVLGVARLGGVGPFAHRGQTPSGDRAARARELGAIETAIPSPPPSVAAMSAVPGVMASAIVENVPPPPSATPPGGRPHGVGAGSSPKPGSKALKAGALAPDPFGGPEASAKPKAAPNPYAE